MSCYVHEIVGHKDINVMYQPYKDTKQEITNEFATVSSICFNKCGGWFSDGQRSQWWKRHMEWLLKKSFSRKIGLNCLTVSVVCGNFVDASITHGGSCYHCLLFVGTIWEATFSLHNNLTRICNLNFLFELFPSLHSFPFSSQCSG